MALQRSLVVVALVLVAGMLVAAPTDLTSPARAMAVFNVDSTLDTSDAVPGNGVCDDGAGNCTLRAAVDEANALAGHDTINVPAGTYVMGPALYPSDDLVVVGAGPATTTLRNEGDQEVFFLENGPVHLSLSGITFQNTGGGDCILILDDGPETAAGSTLIVDEAVFDHCGDAGILAATDTFDPDIGGPVYITVTNTEFIGGGSASCSDPNGGCYGVLIDSNGGSFTADNVTVTDARYQGLLLAFNSGDGVVELTNSSVTGALSVGVEVFVQDPFGVDVTISHTQIDGNAVGEFGAFQGIWGGNDNTTWTIMDSSVSNNGRYGAQLSGSVTIERSVFAGNGFGIGSFGEESGAEFYGPGLVSVSDSVFAGNSGYGVAFWGGAGTDSTLINSTVTGNIWGVASSGDSFEVVNTTIAENTEWGLEAYATVNNVVNTIIYGNTLDCANSSGPYTSLGYNLVGDATCGFAGTGDQVGVDPLLGPLQDNGGTTETMALGVGSPAIDAANDLECPPTDQRGFIRPVDGDGVGGAQCDIGAFEAGAGVGPPPGAVVVFWDADLTRHGLLPVDGSFDITLLGDEAGDATATIDLVSWYENADAGGSMLGAPVAATVVVPLVEGPAGEYGASWDPLGVTEIVSLSGELTTAGGTTDDTTTFGLPLSVAGRIDVDVELTVNPVLLPGPRVVVSSSTVFDGDTIPTGHFDGVSSRALRPGDGYGVRVLDALNRTVADDTVVEVVAGLMTQVDMIASPVPLVPFSVKVLGIGDEPLADVEVVVSDESGDEIIKQVTSDDGTVGTVSYGDDIVIVIDPLGLPYEPTAVNYTLTSLDEIVEVSLGTTIPTAIVSGTVTRQSSGDPVAGLDVALISDIGGRYIATQAKTGDDGSYSSEVFHGDVNVSTGNLYLGGATADVVIAGDTVVDLELIPPELVELTVNLSTRLAGEPLAPVDLTWRELVHFRLTGFTSGSDFEIHQNPMEVPALPGAAIEVCADGKESGLGTDCDIIFADASLEAEANLELTQAARVTGTLRLSDGSVPGGSWWAATFAVNPDGSRHTPRTYQGPGDVLTIGFADPGAYEIDIETERERLTVPVTVTDGDVVDLGIVQLAASSGRFGGAGRTSVTLAPHDAEAGQTLTARLEAENGSGTDVTGTTLALRVPDDVTVDPDSVLLDGVPVVSVQSGGWLEVDAGDIPGGASRTLQAWFETDFVSEASQVITQGRIDYDDGDPESELLGIAIATIRRVTVDAPQITDVRTVNVSGRAPAGSLVTVTADGTVVATATATPGRLWQARIKLPESPYPRAWSLQAEADTLPEPTRSARRTIRWDPSHNPLERVVMKQSGGGAVEFRPVDGVAYFPFVVQGGNAVELKMYFKDPDRVKSATAFIGTSPAGRGEALYRDLELDCYTAIQPFRRDLCYWEASVVPTLDILGDIYFDWESEPLSLDLSPTPLPPPLTTEQLRAQLPAPLNSFTDLVGVDGPDQADASFSVPELGVDVAASLRATPGVYAPTNSDLDVASQAGAPIYNIDSSHTLNDDLFEVVASFFVPDSAKTNKSPAAAYPNAEAGVEAAGEFVEVILRVTNQGSTSAQPKAIGSYPTSGARPHSGVTAFAGNALSAAGWALGPKTDPEDLLDEIDGNAKQLCTEEAYAGFQTQVQEIRDQLTRQFGANVAMTAIGFLTGPIGGLVVALIGLGLDQAMAAQIRSMIESLINDIVGDPNCVPPPQTPGRKAASPTYVYDPSGFSFEVFEDVRLEGVSATVQFSDTAEGPWEIWDADWFGQVNPQVTDPEGRYGWDVPEGWWRVRFDKEGYATAFSEVLEVLPPHFDVNVPLVSLSSPVIGSGTGYEENTFLEVSFENFVHSDWVTDFNAAVTDEGDNPVPVVISVMDERTTEDGDNVAKVFRFDTGGPLALHDLYTVTFDQSVPSYAGIPAGEDLEVVIEVGTLNPFTDDDDSEFEDDIEWMYNEGVVMACNPPENDMVCPDDLVTRAMVASYFVAALDLTDDGGGDLFVDDDGSEFESDIDKLAAAGITFGCNPPTNDMFCPDGFVTRGEIAAFFVRGLDLFDDGGGDWFVDDDDSVFESDIDKLRAAAITYGCNPPTNDMFCPDAWLTKGQISALFHRALG